MKTTSIASMAVIALLLAGVGTAVFANGFQMNSSPQNVSSNSSTGANRSWNFGCRGLIAGETLSVTGLKGTFQNGVQLTARRLGGTASGSLTLQVSTIFLTGCTLSITGGALTLVSSTPPTRRTTTTSATTSSTSSSSTSTSATYGITGGTIVISGLGRAGDGSGSTSTGSFLIQISALRSSSSASVSTTSTTSASTATANLGAVTLDLKDGTSEFLVHLH